MLSSSIRYKKRYILIKIINNNNNTIKSSFEKELNRIFGFFDNLRLGLYIVYIKNNYIILRSDANSLNIVLAGLFLVKNVGILKPMGISGSIKQLKKQIR